MISIQMKIGKYGEKHDKITLNQFTLTTVIILILTLGSAADTSYKPQDSMTWYNKGYATKELGNNDEAIKAFDKAIEINPQNSNTWSNKGTLSNQIK